MVRSGLQGEQVEGGKEIHTSGSAVGRGHHSCGWLRNWLEGFRQRLQGEGGGERRAGASWGFEHQWRPFSFELWETQPLCKAAGKTAVARKSLKLQEETRDETDRWTGLPGDRAAKASGAARSRAGAVPRGPGWRGPSLLAGDRCSVAPVPYPFLVTRRLREKDSRLNWRQTQEQIE